MHRRTVETSPVQGEGLSPAKNAFGYGQARPLSGRVILLIAALVTWSFVSDLMTVLSGTNELDRDLLLEVVSLAALTFGVLICAVRSSLGSAVVLIGALLQILEDPPLLALVVLLVSTLLVAHTTRRALARLHLSLATAWLLLHLVLVPGDQWILWGYVPCLIGLYLLGSHLARLRDDNAGLQEQSRLDRETQRLAVEAERRNIARDLHDIVAHDMTLVAMQSDAARICKDPLKVNLFLDAISDASHQSLHDLRVMMKVLAPNADDSHQREATPVSNQLLRREIDNAAQRLTALGFTVDVSIGEQIDELYRATQVALAPVIRESATNIMKHTDADGGRFARLDVSSVTGPLVIKITSGPISDGTTNLSLPSGRFGLVCLADRMQLLGGTFQSGPVGDRWVVETSLPPAVTTSRCVCQ